MNNRTALAIFMVALTLALILLLTSCYAPRTVRSVLRDYGTPVVTDDPLLDSVKKYGSHWELWHWSERDGATEEALIHIRATDSTLNYWRAQ